MSNYETIYNNSEINFDGKFSTLITSDEEYDPNIFENVNQMQTSNQNLFSNLHKIFSDEQDRIFNIFKTDQFITDVTDKISIDMNNVDIDYEPDKFLKELEDENKKRNEIIEKQLNEKFDFDINDLITNIDKFKNYYKNTIIETFKLENEIKDILKKYDNQYSNMKQAYSNLIELNEFDEHLEKMDYEMNIYIKNYFEKNNLLEKLNKYKTNIENLNFQKKQINKINALSYVPFCNICMNRIVDSVLIPCGHTGCQECINKCENKCFVCRKEITQIKKIFIN